MTLSEHTIEIRVRYQETDGQGRVHHANYLTYFEQGRVEMMRSSGYSYRELEKAGIMLVVSEMTCQYFLPAVYDDLLQLTTTTVRAKGARIEHHYSVMRGEDLVAKGRSIIACVSASGGVRRLPPWLREKKPS